HRIQSRRDPKQMPHALGRFIAIKIFVALEILRPREAASNEFRGNKIVGRRVNLDPVARAQEQRLSATTAPQYAIGLGSSAETFERFHIRSVMTEPNAKQIHGMCV